MLIVVSPCERKTRTERLVTRDTWDAALSKMDALLFRAAGSFFRTNERTIDRRTNAFEHTSDLLPLDREKKASQPRCVTKSNGTIHNPTALESRRSLSTGARTDSHFGQRSEIPRTVLCANTHVGPPRRRPCKTLRLQKDIYIRRLRALPADVGSLELLEVLNVRERRTKIYIYPRERERERESPLERRRRRNASSRRGSFKRLEGNKGEHARPLGRRAVVSERARERERERERARTRDQAAGNRLRTLPMELQDLQSLRVWRSVRRRAAHLRVANRLVTKVSSFQHPIRTLIESSNALEHVSCGFPGHSRSSQKPRDSEYDTLSNTNFTQNP